MLLSLHPWEIFKIKMDMIVEDPALSLNVGLDDLQVPFNLNFSVVL